MIVIIKEHTGDLELFQQRSEDALDNSSLYLWREAHKRIQLLLANMVEV